MVKTRKLLPKLRPVSYKNKKYKYKLNASTKYRKMAINEGITSEAKRQEKQGQAAVAKGKV